MWIQVRTMDGKKSVRIDGLSKLTKIEELREKLVEPFEATTDVQRLFYRGKQMIDGHTLFDYNVGLNEIVQILIRAAPGNQNDNSDTTQESTLEADESSSLEREKNCGEGSSTSSNAADSQDAVDNLNTIYKLGDVIDARDDTMGAWFEASIIKISCRKESKSADGSGSGTSVEEGSEKTELSKIENKEESSETQESDDGTLYTVKFDGEDGEELNVTCSSIRPRARRKIPFGSVKVGDRVMLNFNYDEPETRGYWYDAVVTKKRSTRTIKELLATVYIGKDLVPFENCKITFVDELFAIEKSGDQLNINHPTGEQSVPEKRENKPECSHCGDAAKRKCKFCGCSVCGDKKEPEKQIMCDECDQPYHIYCLNPPLSKIPEVDEWYCPECKNDTNEVVRAGEKLKDSKKKSKMASANSAGTRDWGKGMACVGRTKVCTIVPPNHFGLVPGIEVGMCWKFRVQASEAGVHRPHVAGIHGREDEGAYSIVLAGGYEDDQDDGEEFTYTGSGGRDLSGNKRTAEQSCDQTLTRMNRALAKNVCASINDKKGADAGDKWREGKPVRVLRSCKGRKHSEFSPEDGIRYDGIYKIVRYWAEKGKSGFMVWRYMLRRDDPSPAPWTEEGQKRIEELGLAIQYPEGYLESKQAQASSDNNESTSKGKKTKGKRKRIDSDDENEENDPEEEQKKVKKQRRSVYRLESSTEKLIKSDTQNEKLWAEAMDCAKDGAQAFLSKVEETFLCICCQEVVFKPVTTTCQHNMCKSCLERSFKADVYSCPACRSELGKNYKIAINTPLSEALLALFPGYENGR